MLTEEFISEIEARVRRTIGPTFQSDGRGGMRETIEGRISEVDFNALLKYARDRLSLQAPAEPKADEMPPELRRFDAHGKYHAPPEQTTAPSPGEAILLGPNLETMSWYIGEVLSKHPHKIPFIGTLQIALTDEVMRHVRPAPTREQIIAWCRDRFGAESAEAVAEDISSSLISPSPKASTETQ